MANKRKNKKPRDKQDTTKRAKFQKGKGEVKKKGKGVHRKSDGGSNRRTREEQAKKGESGLEKLCADYQKERIKVHARGSMCGRLESK